MIVDDKHGRARPGHNCIAAAASIRIGRVFSFLYYPAKLIVGILAGFRVVIDKCIIADESPAGIKRAVIAVRVCFVVKR
jgi:hypothetical protein